jgi:hypothetical protein
MAEQGSRTRSASDALLKSVELAEAVEKIGVDYNEHVVDNVLRHVATGLVWR